MFESDRSLVGAEQPSFQQRDHAVDARKQMFSLLLATLDLAVVEVSVQSHTDRQSVGANGAARRDGLGYEPVEGGLGQMAVALAPSSPDGRKCISKEQRELIFCMVAEN